LILVHPAAAEEARSARLRYAQQDPAVGRRFLREYDRALERVRDHPERWPIYPHLTGAFRWCRFRRFPYAVIYEVVPPDIHVLAIAADKRRPGYWERRKADGSAHALPDRAELSRTAPNSPGHKLLSVQQTLVISSDPREFDSRRLHHRTQVAFQTTSASHCRYAGA
jgi:hypothetical protein